MTINDVPVGRLILWCPLCGEQVQESEIANHKHQPDEWLLSDPKVN